MTFKITQSLIFLHILTHLRCLWNVKEYWLVYTGWCRQWRLSATNRLASIYQIISYRSIIIVLILCPHHPTQIIITELDLGICCTQRSFNVISFWTLTGCFSSLVAEGFILQDSSQRKIKHAWKYRRLDDHLLNEKKSHCWISSQEECTASSLWAWRGSHWTPKLVSDWETVAKTV